MTEEQTCFVITLLTEVPQTWQRLLYILVHINPVIKCYVISFALFLLFQCQYLHLPASVPVKQLALFDGLLLCLNYFKIELSCIGGLCHFKNLAF